MKIIVDHKDTKVIYDKKKDVYIKKFYPKFRNKIKFFFGLRKYPGINFYFITKVLKNLDIMTPEVIGYSKYKVITKNIRGTVLREYLKNDDSILKEFLELIIKILKNGIYYSDFNTKNFIVKNHKIYPIDLEGYKTGVSAFKSKKEIHERLIKALMNDEWVEYIEKRL